MTTSGEKVALVVGASSGFGLHVAAALLERGIIVYAAARRTGPMQALADRGAHLLCMDVCDACSVQSGIDQIMAETGRVDIVFNNAGYGVYGACEAVPLEDIQRQFDVNLFGVARVNKAVLPIMRAQNSGRLILTSSLAAHVSPSCSGWYSATKHALNAVADALRGELLETGIKIIQIEPGPVQTGFESVAWSGMDKLAHPAAYRRIVSGYRNYMARSYAHAPGPESTIKAMLDAALSARPRAVYRTTPDARLLPVLRFVLGTRLFGALMTKQFLKSA